MMSYTMGDEHTVVQLVSAGGPEYISGVGYTFQLQDGSQVLIRTDPGFPDGVDRPEEPSAALTAAQSAEACAGGPPALLLDVPEEPVVSGSVPAAPGAVVEPSAAVEAVADAAGDPTHASAAARLEAAGCEPGRRRVAVVLSDEGVATAVPLQAVVEAGLSQRVLFQEDGQPVILEVLDQDQEPAAEEPDCDDPLYQPSAPAAPEPEPDTQTSWQRKKDAGGDGPRKTGMWSREEVDTLSANMQQYCRDRGIANPEDIIFRCSKDERKNFYRTVAQGINRPLFSIYRRILRMYDQKNHVGRYTEDEVEQLRNLRAIHGNRWGTIGALMGRSAASVKDRVRVLRDNCNQGKWLREEEERLEQAVYDLTGSLPGQPVTSGINWAAVAQKVITRSEKQCRSKWLNNLSWKTMGGEEWTRDDDFRLVSVLLESSLADEGDIDWTSLTEDWPRTSVRSPQWLRARWWTLKQQFKNHQRLTFREVLSALRDFLRPGNDPESPPDPDCPAAPDDPPPPPPAEPQPQQQQQPPPQPLIPPGARLFVDQEGRVIPGGAVSVIHDDGSTFAADPLADPGPYGGSGGGGGGTAVVFGGQLYAALPGVPHLLMAADSVVMEPAAAGLLHHPAAALQPDESGVALVSSPSLPDHEYSDGPGRLAQASHTSVIRGDPIMSRTAPGATSEDEGLDCPQ